MKKTVLVTGGHGFLGRAVARGLKARGFSVIGTGNGRWAKAEYQYHGFDEWLDANITVSSLLSLGKKFDVILHCAGNGSVSYSVANPYQDFQKTVSSTAEVLEYIRFGNPGAVLVYPSSAGVYGEKPDAPIKESASLTPISPYGYHKKIVESLCESYSRSYGLKVAIVRFFSIYGPGLTKQLLWDATLKLLSEGEVVFWGTGEETRDWIYIDDAVNLMEKASESDEMFAIVNGASGERYTVKKTIDLLRTELGLSSVCRFNGKVRAGDPRFYHADVSKAKSLGWAPRTGFTEGLSRYVEWYKGLRK